MKEPGSVFGKRLRDYRKRLNMSQLEFGSMLDVDHTVISCLESGRRRPTTKLIEKMSEVLEENVFNWLADDQPVLPPGSFINLRIQINRTNNEPTLLIKGAINEPLS